MTTNFPKLPEPPTNHHWTKPKPVPTFDKEVKGTFAFYHGNADGWIVVKGDGNATYGPDEHPVWFVRAKLNKTKPQFNLPAPVRIGVLKTIPAVYEKPDGTKTSQPREPYPDRGCYVSYELISEALYNQWTDTGTVGLLINFFTESCDDGEIVVGLVELPSGQFETFSASCLKLVEATKY